MAILKNSFWLLFVLALFSFAGSAIAGGSTYIPDAPKPVGEGALGALAIASYIEAIYQYALGSVGIIAVVVMMFGGVRWILAGGNAGQAAQAKSMITAALVGLVLTLCSYTILYLINPELLQFKPIIAEPPSEKLENGCCKILNGGCRSDLSDNCSGDGLKFYPAMTCDPQKNACVETTDTLGGCITAKRISGDLGICSPCLKNVTLDKCKQLMESMKYNEYYWQGGSGCPECGVDESWLDN